MSSKKDSFRNAMQNESDCSKLNLNVSGVVTQFSLGNGIHLFTIAFPQNFGVI